MADGAQAVAGDGDDLKRSFQDYLVGLGKLTPQTLDRARHLQVESGERLETILTKLGMITERDLAEAFADHLALPLLTRDDFPAEPLFTDRVSRKFLHQSQCLPVEERPEGLVVAMADPLDPFTVQALQFLAKKEVLRRVATASDIRDAIERLYTGSQSSIDEIFDEIGEARDGNSGEDVERLKDLASETPVIRLVNLLISQAVDARASDIHIEPMEDRLRVRFRVDGILHDVDAPPQRLSAAIVSRVKIMAKLDIAERRLAQDGRVRLAVRGQEIDFRVSTTPTMHGESVVLRILDRTRLALDFAALGFEGEALGAFLTMLRQPHGIILVTGPTGSGKTTTLYTSLRELNTADKKLLTIEDPVEYLVDGINQVQVNSKAGHGFATALRSFLRQDPDVIMVGEIRDLETARIAVQAALTGHLVLSTVHTNDAATAVTRLLDMGVEDFLVTSTVTGIVGQRLVRTLCTNCRQAYDPDISMIEKLNLRAMSSQPRIRLFKPIGCGKCGQTGYHGRTSILEVLVMSDPLRSLVMAGPEVGKIQKCAIADGMQTMYCNGLAKALAGVTTVEEVLRVTREAG
ncbi:MAG: type II secretion system ATPase GspE [Sphingomonadales bacterium]